MCGTEMRILNNPRDYLYFRFSDGNGHEMEHLQLVSPSVSLTLKTGSHFAAWLAWNLLFRPGWPQTNRNLPASAL